MLFPIAIISGIAAVFSLVGAFAEGSTKAAIIGSVFAAVTTFSTTVLVGLAPDAATVIGSDAVQETPAGVYTLTADGRYYAVVNTDGETVLLPTERTVVIPNAESARFEQWDEVPNAPRWLVTDLTGPSQFKLYVP